MLLSFHELLFIILNKYNLRYHQFNNIFLYIIYTIYIYIIFNIKVIVQSVYIYDLTFQIYKITIYKTIKKKIQFKFFES